MSLSSDIDPHSLSSMDDPELPQPLYTDHRHGMKIKLKINKPNDLGDRELKIEEKVKEEENYRNGEEIEPIELTRVVAEKQLDLRACDFCGKTFGNGKALGGHRRIHLYGGDGQIQKTAAKKARIDHHHQDSSDRRSSDPNRTCCICGKSFPSEKSLFGHMRFHPERTWRGVKPPAGDVVAVSVAPAKLSSSSSTISDEEVPDLDDDRDPREFVDLIGSLTGWAQKNRRGKRSTYVDPSDPSVRESDRTDGNDPGRYGYHDDDTVHDDVAAHSLLYLSQGTSHKARIGYGHNHGSYDGEEVQRFRCGTCGRDFATFQALGGHRSSHSKINGGESTSSDNHRQNCDDGVHEHKCKICDRSFPSGQALGGHQRSHWAGPINITSETTSSGPGKRKLEIDLNEPPLEETDEEEEAAGGAQSGWYELINGGN